MSINTARRKMVERISARVFCHLDEAGGNPVTIFSSQDNLSPAAQQKLAKQCDWESVMVHHNNRKPAENQSSKSKSVLPQLSFYMPSGEQVSFCAHAAMGAALEICLQNDKDRPDAMNNDDSDDYDDDEVSFTVANLPEEPDNKNNNENKEYKTTMYEGDIVALNMTTTYEQSDLPQSPLLFRMLREYCGLDAHDLASTPADSSPSSGARTNKLSSFEKDYPYTNCNASIARPKTLIPLRSVRLLQEKAVAPASSAAAGFATTCSLLKGGNNHTSSAAAAAAASSGLYLYAKSTSEDGAWECRQFPRASGYPEDPATGIAAAALACYLRSELDIDLPAYKFYQGTAMGKPSLIVVDELELVSLPPSSSSSSKHNSSSSSSDDTVGQSDGASTTMDASFRLLGRVEIDDRESIEIDDDDDDPDPQ